jgi:hypothetical protein
MYLIVHLVEQLDKDLFVDVLHIYTFLLIFDFLVACLMTSRRWTMPDTSFQAIQRAEHLSQRHSPNA